MAAPELTQADGYWRGSFRAMAGPCELLLEVDDRALAQRMLTIAADEAVRIEHRFSRYRDDNPIHRINTSAGAPVTVDDETADLIDYAARCHEMSDGRFDITSGVLRRVWRFDGSDHVPADEVVQAVLHHVGWRKARWQRPVLQLEPGMEIDLGGLGKEYAVDRTARLLRQETDSGFVVNFGGDLYISGPRRDGAPWVIGLDDPQATGARALGELRVQRGGIATSGDARRYLLKDGVRYSHILDPRTGWPVTGAPHAVTVVAGTCLEAGVLATFALLHGSGARAFLETQDVPFWIAPGD
jgi:thiamine biosynthesis lipoprotein